MNTSSTLRTSAKQSFWISLKIQGRVIKALFLREMISHFGRHNIGFLWMFAEPMMFSVGITILWTVTGHKHGAMPAAGFALTGYSALVAWRNCIGRTSITLSANKGLLFHRNVTVLDLALTRAIFEFSAVSISLPFLSIIFISLGLMEFPIDVLKILSAWILLGWFFICAGLITVFLNHKSELFHRISHVLMYLTLPLTGVFAMVSWLPKKLQSVYLLSPMVNGVEMLRAGYFGEKVQAQYSISFLLICNIALTAVALLLVSQVKKLIEPE
ncbi:ABC transporter permease [Polynucleobacter sphagniphilus]|uniref:ABC transporter permease n=1 Tax=Polynucleobacter sphagniphilus TaxID=1743169 RepID=UPI0024757620|nr:ABC transporter permease [Polynucleobacter sphagniphilus]MDH6299950.1 capsular polysaccharide transport system permease protein [Polynucleobacter sphagniphilus]